MSAISAPRALSPMLTLAGYGALATAVCVLVFAAPRFLQLSDAPWLAAPVVCLIAAGAAVVLLGPARWALSLFVLYMTASHLYNSPFVVPAAGVEWHPRELLLLLFLGRFGVEVLKARAVLTASPVHFFVGAFGLAWVSMAVTGLLHANSPTNWIAEARYPFFLLAYPALLAFMRTPADVWRVARLLLGIALLIAVAGITLFLVLFAMDMVINNEQNYLGEYVRRQVGPYLLQSVRPNGHMYFEIGCTILISLFFSRGLRLHARAGIVLTLGIFAFAILITMMRTAYVTTALGVGLFLIASLPRVSRGPLLLLGIGGLLFGMLAFGPTLYGKVDTALPALEISLKGRLEEVGGGLGVFAEHPIFGGGLGNTFQAMGYVAKSTQASYGQATYLMVHNVWLYYLFKGGLVAFLLALFGLGGIAAYGWWLSSRLGTSLQRGFCRGLACAFTAQCIGSLAMPRFNYPAGIVFILLTAVAFVVLGECRHSGNSAIVIDNER